MTMLHEVPTAVHIGKDDLPFVDIGDGAKLKVIHVDVNAGLWIVENIFQAGFAVQTRDPTMRIGAGLLAVIAAHAQ